MTLYTSLEESDLYLKLQQGNMFALKAFFKLYGDSLYAYVMGRIHHQAESEDMVQEAFIALWKNRQVFTSNNGVYAYLFQTIKNRCVNYELHQQVERKYMSEHQSYDYWEEAIPESGSEVYQHIQALLDTLPPKCKEIFIMGCVDELSYKEIAEKEGVSVNTVKTQIKIAYKKLKTELLKQNLPAGILVLEILCRNII